MVLPKLARVFQVVVNSSLYIYVFSFANMYYHPTMRNPRQSSTFSFRILNPDNYREKLFQQNQKSLILSLRTIKIQIIKD